MRKMITLLSIAVITVGSASVCGSTLVSIGVLDEAPPSGGTAESAVHALSPGAEYAVGYSNAADLGGSVTISQPIIWSVGDGLVQLPNSQDTDADATGVVIRPLFDRIGVAANIGGYMMYYGAPMNDLTNGMWILNGRPDAITGPYNTAQLAIGYEPPTYFNPWLIGGDYLGSVRDFVQGVDGIANLDHSNQGYGNLVSHSVSGNKLTAGYDHGNPGEMPRALFMDKNNNFRSDPPYIYQTTIPGGSGVTSEAYGITSDSTALCGYDTDLGGGTTQAFVWKVGNPAMTLLGTLGSDTDSIGIDVKLIGSDYIVCGSSTGTNEQAVVWDTTGVWDSSGTPQLLTTLLTNAGVDCSEWTRLTRATTMADSGAVIAGYGIWAADGTKRGFVASLSSAPEVTSAISVKTHGAAGDFSINVLDGADIECRRYGVTTLVVTFDADIQGVGGLDPTDVALSPQGVVNAVSLSASNELTINMSNTANIIPLIVTFPGIANASDAGAISTDSVCILQLMGDVVGDGVITALDRVKVRDEIVNPVGASNFRMDIYAADGTINALDRVYVRNAMTTGLIETCP